MQRTIWLRTVVGVAATMGAAHLHAQGLPEGPGKDAVQKACGTCHAANIVAGRAMNRDQWSKLVTDMVAKGAKINETEFVQVVDYLARTFPPGGPAATTAAAPGAAARPARRPGGGLTQGPNDRHVVDRAAADRGKATYIAECITCHGNKARGGEGGPDLVRSTVVLHDRYGDTIIPFLKKGHPTQSGTPIASFSNAKLEDLGNFLHLKVEETLRGGPYSEPVNVLTGNAKAGEAYFNGAGRCSSCHSPTGDLAHIAGKYDPPALQQKFLFPRTLSFGRGGRMAVAKPVTVTVTAPGAAPVTGVLERLDDFNVALRDSEGEYRSWKRVPGMKVEKHDPYAAHEELLDQITDKNIHDVVAYLETLK